MSKELFQTTHGPDRVPRGGEQTVLRLYLKHAAVLFRTFDRWKDVDRFYFIPIPLNMAYYGPGWVEAVAYPPYHLGTIIRNSLKHPTLFGTTCACGQEAYAFSYNGSPLSGRFDLSYACPSCGSVTGTTESGWRVRSAALRETQKADRPRLRSLLGRTPDFEPASLQELLRLAGVPEEEQVQPLKEG